MAGFGSEQQWLPSAFVEGVGNLGVFDKFNGGDLTAAVVKYRPGGMGPEVTYLTLPVITDVTLTRVYEQQRDHALIAKLHTLSGRATASVTLQPLDTDGNPFGNPRTYQGRLGTVKDGQTDSMGNAIRMWELDIVCETVAG